MASRPDNDTILDDATRLKTERFQLRDVMIASRIAERFNQTKIDVPAAYNTTAQRHKSQILNDEGRQVATLVYAMPVPHISPPTPEDQPATTTEEQFLIAFHAELEAAFGPVWWQSTLEQVHNNISWDYLGWRKVPYKGQPKPPEATDLATTTQYGIDNERFKKDAGVRSYADYRHVPTSTAYWSGNVYDPDRFYEIKDVAERDLMDTYGIVRNKDGSFSKASKEPTTTPSGYPENQGGTETRIRVVEYWDREWCVIVAETLEEKWLGMRHVRGAYVLDEWKHGWGRVPYFARPAFVTEQLEEDKKFEGPLDGVYTEMPEHKLLRTMGFSVAYQTAFSPLQITTKEQGDLILDAGGKMVESLKLVPGEARQMAPGQQIGVVPQSPEVANLFQVIAASDARIAHYSLTEIMRGISPGADSSNAAISNLHRAQLSILDPLAQQASRQASAMGRFILERIKDSNERFYVFDSTTDSHLSLAAPEIVSVNVQAKVTPDQGQFQLLIEKHATEQFLAGVGTEQSMYEMMGKENPEELVAAAFVDKIRRNQIMPVVAQQVVSMYGLTDAIKRMMKQNAQAGDGGDGAISDIMADAQAMQGGEQPSGMGQGSGGMPRTPGDRMPVEDVDTAGANMMMGATNGI